MKKIFSIILLFSLLPASNLYSEIILLECNSQGIDVGRAFKIDTTNKIVDDKFPFQKSPNDKIVRTVSYTQKDNLLLNAIFMEFDLNTLKGKMIRAEGINPKMAEVFLKMNRDESFDLIPRLKIVQDFSLNCKKNSQKYDQSKVNQVFNCIDKINNSIVKISVLKEIDKDNLIISVLFPDEDEIIYHGLNLANQIMMFDYHPTDKIVMYQTVYKDLNLGKYKYVLISMSIDAKTIKFLDENPSSITGYPKKDINNLKIDLKKESELSKFYRDLYLELGKRNIEYEKYELICD